MQRADKFSISPLHVVSAPAMSVSPIFQFSSFECFRAKGLQVLLQKRRDEALKPRP
jgi:hypothetical protein